MTWEGVILILGALGVGTIIGEVIKKKRPKGERELALLEQVQEERKLDRERIASLERRQRLTEDYVYELRQHIADGKPPPPPAFPPGLVGGEHA